jgi:hypothetical protein
MKKLAFLLIFAINVNAMANSIDEVINQNIKRNNGLVTDTLAGLIWEDTKHVGEQWFINPMRRTDTHTYSEANKYCKNLNINGINNFRIPTAAELKYLHQIKKFFKHISNEYAWSSTPYEKKTGWFYAIEFDDDKWSAGSINAHFTIRCVSGHKYTDYDNLIQARQTNLMVQVEQLHAKQYENAHNINTIESYNNFIERYPNASQVKSAKKEIENLYLLAYDRAKQKNTIAAYTKFIKTYPKAPQIKESLENIYLLTKQKNTITAYAKFIKTYPKSPQVKDALINLYKLINKDNLLKNIKQLSEIVNQYNDKSLKKFTFKLLNQTLNKYKNIDAYFIALETLDENTPNIKNIADALVKQIWIQVIEPPHDLYATIKFIREFKDGEGSIISKAYDRAISLENKSLEKKYKKLIDEKTSFFFIKANQEEEEKIKEKIARQLFIEAVQSRDNGDDVTFSIKYHVVTNNKLFKQTESAFNLYRDKEMKRFFTKQFKNLKDTTRNSSHRIIEKLDEVNSKLTQLDETMSTSPSEEDIYEENRKFLMQSYIFDKAMKTHDDE